MYLYLPINLNFTRKNILHTVILLQNNHKTKSTQHEGMGSGTSHKSRVNISQIIETSTQGKQKFKIQKQIRI